MTKIACFSGTGEIVAGRLAEGLQNEAIVSRIGENNNITLSQWVKDSFSEADEIVFVGACGIAVRAIAPFIVAKDRDPAVVVVDELGKFAIPVLSGHLGGANELARRIACITGGEAVITTATDINGAFAVDLWAKKQGCCLSDIGLIKKISSKILDGTEIIIKSEFNILGEVTKNVAMIRAGEKDPTGKYDIYFGINIKEKGVLTVIPKICILGIGMRRGTQTEKIKAAVVQFLAENSIDEKAVEGLASIDIKSDEEGLIRFAESKGWNISFYSADELNELTGTFSSSEFVRQTTGTDNVCERSAAKCAGNEPLIGKWTCDGITLALAVRKRSFDWSYRDE